MSVKRFALAVVAALLAVALAGCGETDETSPYVDENSLAFVYGVPALPAAQGIIDFSTSRAVSVLENFNYREHDGEGQWTDNPAIFDMVDSGSPATLDAENSAGKGGWILTLSAYKKDGWSNCTLKGLEAGKDPERAELAVYPQRGVSFAELQETGDFINDVFQCTRGVVALDSSDGEGRIAFAVVQNMSGGVCQIIQEAPGVFRFEVHAKAQWSDGSYDMLVDECKKLAEDNGYVYGEFAKNAPLFQEPYIEFSK